MGAEQSRHADLGRVIPFPPRPPRGAPERPETPFSDSETVVADLRRYQRAREEEDYRHRMVVNALALAFCIVLAIAGVWLANEIAEMKRIEDCVLAGRTACVPLPISANARF